MNGSKRLNKSSSGKIGSSLGLSLLLTGTAFAAISPEIPEFRTAQVFAPYFFSFGDQGSSVI
ncbi:MAG: hypothetical protein PHU21_04505, partial [Elusimicrobia bacterium]|nr:hypothetical protein [Elusimicrobiota bacterium]